MNINIPEQKTNVISERIHVETERFQTFKDSPWELVPFEDFEKRKANYKDFPIYGTYMPVEMGALYGVPFISKKSRSPESGILLKFSAISASGPIKVDIVINDGEFSGSQRINFDSNNFNLEKSVADLDIISNGKLNLSNLKTLEIRLDPEDNDYGTTIYKFTFIHNTITDNEIYLDNQNNNVVFFNTLKTLPLFSWETSKVYAPYISDGVVIQLDDAFVTNFWKYNSITYSTVVVEIIQSAEKRFFENIANIYAISNRSELIDQNLLTNFKLNGLLINDKKTEMNINLNFIESEKIVTGSSSKKIELWSLKINDPTYYDYENNVTIFGKEPGEKLKKGYQIPHNFQGGMEYVISGDISSTFLDQKIVVSMDFKNPILDENNGSVKLEIEESTMNIDDDYDLAFKFSSDDFNKIIKEKNITLDFLNRLSN